MSKWRLFFVSLAVLVATLNPLPALAQYFDFFYEEEEVVVEDWGYGGGYFDGGWLPASVGLGGCTVTFW